MDFILNDQNAKIRKSIHLIRHGQTDYNLKNIIQGSGIDSNLNLNGRNQAKRFFEAYRQTPYKRIYTSELKRAVQSVESFIQSGIPHTALSAFNEINWGIMEGRNGNEDSSKLYAQIINKWSSGALDTAVEGGETPLDMYRRQSEGLRQVMQAADEEHILICMHGRALRSFLCLLTNTPLKEMEKWQHSNLCLYALEFNGKTFDVINGNDTRHLEDSR